MKAAIIVSGKLRDDYDFIVGVENGAIENASKIDIAISDFDSVDEKKLAKIDESKIIKLDSEKDETDVEAAINYLIEKEYELIDVYLSDDSDRVDHLFTNLLLSYKYNVNLIFDNAVVLSGTNIDIPEGCIFSVYTFEKGTIEIENAKFNFAGEIDVLDTNFISNESFEDCVVKSDKVVICYIKKK